MDDQVGDLVRGQQFAMAARMARLGTALASGRGGGRARRGTGRIRGGRARRVARVLLEVSFELGDAGVKGLDLVEQGEHGGSDGGRSRLPIRWRDAEWWRKLVHSRRMQERNCAVNP
jgi:hypothetical protein